MNFLDEKIQEIIKNNCGDPPCRELLQQHIELNTWKLNNAVKPIRNSVPIENDPEEQQYTINTYRRLIAAGKDAYNNLNLQQS